MSQTTNHLNHSTWECKYHVVFTPKYRKKTLFGRIRRDLKDVFHRLASQKGCVIEEGHLMSDHVHMLISIPPKESGCQGDRFFEGKEFDLGGAEYRQQEEKFRGAQVLGARLFRLHDRRR